MALFGVALFLLNGGTRQPIALAAAGINHEINFQGKLVNPNGTNVTDGTYSIVFSIYNVSSGGTPLWSETQSVAMSDGIFQVDLGSVTPLPGSVDFNSDSIYLGIKVGADAEMTPRIQFTAVPQAFNAEKLGGLDKSGFIQNSTSSQTANFNISGTGQIGTSLTVPLLQSASGTALNITGNAASVWGTSANNNLTIQAGGSGTLTLDTGGAGTVNVGYANATAVRLGRSAATVSITGNSSSTFVLNGVTVDATEFNRLDGHDAALVDTNDAVSTAIIGTGALNAGSITSGFGSIDVGADPISTTGLLTGGTLSVVSDATIGGVLTANSLNVGSSKFTVANTGLTSIVTSTGGPILYVKEAGAGYGNPNAAIVADTDNTTNTEHLFQGRSGGINVFDVQSNGAVISSGMLQGTQFKSTVATGTAPLIVTSTTLVSNFNADLLDGQQGSYYQSASNMNAGTLADSRLSSNVDLLNAAQTITGVKTFSATANFTASGTGLAVTNDATVGGALTVGGAGSFGGNVNINNNTITNVGRKPRVVLFGANSNLASNASTYNWLVSTGHVDGTVDFSSTAAQLAADDYDVYMCDYKNWSATPCEATAYTLWKTYGKNVMTIGNDSTTGLYPITGMTGHASSVYSSTVTGTHVIVRGMTATDVGNGTDSGMDITSLAPNFTPLYTLTADSTKIEGAIGESEAGGIWFHDQTSFLSNNGDGQQLLLNTLNYETGSDVSMLSARVSNAGYRNIQNALTVDDTTNNVNLVSGNLQVGGVTVLTSGRALQGITSLTVNGDIGATAVNATGYTTTNTGSTYTGQYTRLGYCTLTVQYQDCRSQATMVSTGDVGTMNRAIVDIRVKQQNALGGAPYVAVQLIDDNTLSAGTFIAVPVHVQSDSTTVELWFRDTTANQVYRISPLVNSGSVQFTWQANQGFQTALPSPDTGMGNTTAVYASQNVASLSVNDVSIISTAGILQNAALSGTYSNTLTFSGTSNSYAGTWNGNTISVTKGGTGATTIGSAGSLAYSNGSSYAFTGVGTSGQCLLSGGTGAPTWGGCVSSSSGFVQGGNSFGTAATLGTNDNYDLNFETNNKVRMSISATSNVITFNNTTGTDVAELRMPNSSSIGLGSSSLQSNTTGSGNTAVGTMSLLLNTTGYNNTAIGNGSLSLTTSGSNNTAAGYAALLNNSSGTYNVALGSGALQTSTTGSSNTAVGYGALTSNTTGNGNTALGYQAGNQQHANCAVGQGNIYLGYQAGYNDNTCNSLYIANSSTSTPLIQGDFSAGLLTINGTLNATVALQTAGTTRIDSNGNLMNIGLITGQGVNSSSDSVVLNRTFMQGAGSPTTYYKIATLAASNAGTYDHLHLTATLNTGWASNQNSYIDVTFGNRNSFYYQYSLHGHNVDPHSTLAAYQNSDGTVDLYIMLLTSAYTSASYSVLENQGETVYPNPAATKTTTAPTGTLVFDASNPAAYPAATTIDISNNMTLSGNLTVQGNTTKIGNLLQMTANGVTYTALNAYGGDTNGLGLAIGTGGVTIVGAGESAAAVSSNVAYNAETLYLTSDNGISLMTNLQSGWSSGVAALTLANNGGATFGSTITDNRFSVNTNGYVTINDAGAAKGDRLLQVGDDSYFTDVDAGNTLGLYGSTDNTQGKLQLGSGGPILAGSSSGLNINTNTAIGGNLAVGAASTDGARLYVVGAGSANGTAWTAHDAMGYPLTSITYGNGLFVAVSSYGTIVTSPDGITWTTRSSPSSSWQAVTYGNGLFVAISDSTVAATSPDGITWTSRTIPSAPWKSITYGNGLFVAVGTGTGATTIMTSPDGITWTARADPWVGLAHDWNSITYGNGEFLAVGDVLGDLMASMTSTDGVTWTTALPGGGATGTWAAVAYGSGRFVAVNNYSSGTRIEYSADGVNWTSSTYYGSEPRMSVIYANGTFIVLGFDNSNYQATALMSPNGVNFVPPEVVVPGLIGSTSIAYGSGMFVAVDDLIGGVATSSASGAALSVNGDTVLSGSVTLGGILQASGTTQLCLNGAKVSTCSTTATGASFIQGGNSFGANAYLGTDDNYSLNFQTNNTTRLTIDTSGNATFNGGLTVSGATNLSSTLAVNGNYIYASGSRNIIQTTDSYLRLNQSGSFTNGVYTPGTLRVDGGLFLNGVLSGTTYSLNTTGGVCVKYTSCTYALGVSGSIAATGTIVAGHAPDLAETIDAAPDVEAADVVMADPNNTERVVKATGAYTGAAVGVISDGSSSFIVNSHAASDSIGSNGLNGAPMVLAGRVPVKVTGEGGAIQPGDYLTTSSTPGMAMKATHAGPTIGKALGFFNGDTGTVLALINISYYDPSTDGNLQGANLSLTGDASITGGLTLTGTANFAGDLNVSGQTTVDNLTATGSVSISNDLTVSGNVAVQGSLIVAGLTTVGTITVNGHIITGGDAPTNTVSTVFANGAVTATISGNDTTGTITITTSNTSSTLSSLYTDPNYPQTVDLSNGLPLLAMTFNQQFGAAPHVLISPDNTSASSLSAFTDGESATGFTLSANQLPQPGKTYKFTYWATQ